MYPALFKEHPLSPQLQSLHSPSINSPFSQVCDRQLAYGVYPDFQSIAHTRLAQMEETTALDCTSATSGDVIVWYRRSLQTASAALGPEEQIYETLLVDWKWTPTKGGGERKGVIQ